MYVYYDYRSSMKMFFISSVIRDARCFGSESLFLLHVDEVNKTKLQPLVENCLASNELTLLTMGPTFQSHVQLGVVAAVPRGVKQVETPANANAACVD